MRRGSGRQQRLVWWGAVAGGRAAALGQRACAQCPRRMSQSDLYVGPVRRVVARTQAARLCGQPSRGGRESEIGRIWVDAPSSCMATGLTTSAHWPICSCTGGPMAVLFLAERGGAGDGHSRERVSEGGWKRDRWSEVGGRGWRVFHEPQHSARARKRADAAHGAQEGGGADAGTGAGGAAARALAQLPPQRTAAAAR